MSVIRCEVGGAAARIEDLGLSAKLWWSDGIANEWTEEYPTVSLAVLRLASLFKCGESNWHDGFALESEQFEQVGEEFFARVVTQ